MRLAHYMLTGLFSLLVLPGLIGAASTQTPVTDPDDPCASFIPATPALSGGPVDGEPPVIEPGDAVLGSLAIRQQHAVTALEAIIVHVADPDVVTFAISALPEAQEHLDALESIANEEAMAHPAAMVAVVDALRREQDLPADRGGLDAYLAGYVLERLCPEGVDRDAVSRQTLVANDVAIVEIAGIGELVIEDDEARELILDVSGAASDRLTWFDERAVHDATPAATPAS